MGVREAVTPTTQASVWRGGRLLPEEPVKRCAGVVNLGDGGRRFSLHRFSGLKIFALIPEILSADPLGDRLGAFEPTARIEVDTVLAGVEVGFAFGALTFDRDSEMHRQGCPADSTAKDFSDARHLGRTDLFRTARRTWLWLLIVFHVSSLFVLSGHIHSFLD